MENNNFRMIDFTPIFERNKIERLRSSFVGFITWMGQVGVIDLKTVTEDDIQELWRQFFWAIEPQTCQVYISNSKMFYPVHLGMSRN